MGFRLGPRTDGQKKEHSAEYIAYLASPEWREQRQRAIRREGNRCQDCSRFMLNGLEVHHLTYDRLGHEDVGDLRVLCPACHVKADEVRRVNANMAREWSRIDGWARKVYGEDWEDRILPETAEDGFYEWLETQE